MGEQVEQIFEMICFHRKLEGVRLQYYTPPCEICWVGKLDGAEVARRQIKSEIHSTCTRTYRKMMQCTHHEHTGRTENSNIKTSNSKATILYNGIHPYRESSSPSRKLQRIYHQIYSMKSTQMLGFFRATWSRNVSNGGPER